MASRTYRQELNVLRACNMMQVIRKIDADAAYKIVSSWSDEKIARFISVQIAEENFNNALDNAAKFYDKAVSNL